MDCSNTHKSLIKSIIGKNIYLFFSTTNVRGEIEPPTSREGVRCLNR